MPRPRAAMRKIREVLRPHEAEHLSPRAVGIAVGLPRTTVRHSTDRVRQAGWPGPPQQANREPRDADFEIAGKGMYVMPGFVDVHVHGAGKDKAPALSYSYKLWLAHGVTPSRGVSLSSALLPTMQVASTPRGSMSRPTVCWSCVPLKRICPSFWRVTWGND